MERILCSLKRFSRIHDWSAMREFAIILDDVYSIPKKGRLFVDEISVIKSENYKEISA